MKTLGIIGGLGPESTIDYYRLLLAAYQEQRPDGSNPPLLINSVDLKKLRTLVEADRLEEAAAYLAEEVGKLERAGADFGLISANTPHIVFDELQRRVRLPLLSIVEATCRAAKAADLGRLGLLGTRSTMEARFYPDVFSRAGIALVIPEEAERAFIHDKYWNELVKGVFLPETRERLLAIAGRMKQMERIDGLVLAGTELPLLLRDTTIDGLTLLDTTRIHVQAAIERMLAGSGE